MQFLPYDCLCFSIDMEILSKIFLRNTSISTNINASQKLMLTDGPIV